ncbi:MAG: hypothetical protein WCW52_08275 [Elusimicrobiales bacterium]
MTQTIKKFFKSRRMASFALKRGLLLAAAFFTQPTPARALFSGDPALLELGQPGMTQASPNTITASGFDLPRGVAIGGGRIYMADSNNNRVLWWTIAAFTAGQAADGVIGQADLNGSSANRGGSTGRNTLSAPNGVTVNAANASVWIADSGNNRVLRFAAPSPGVNGPDADLVLGQANFTSFGFSANSATLNYPTAVSVSTEIANTDVWISDSGNNRLLKYNNPSMNGAAAALVLGQATFGANAAATTQAGLNYPLGAALEAGGGVWVADSGNNRVLRYDAPVVNGAAAGRVLGQAVFNSGTPNRGGVVAANTLNNPSGVAIDVSGAAVWVADNGGNRVLKFTGALTDGMDATLELGQAAIAGVDMDLANRGGAAALDITLAGPYGVALDGANVWVTDSMNYRLLRYSNPNIPLSFAADTVLGQNDFNQFAVNTPAVGSLYTPNGMALDTVSTPNRLYVADYNNNRVLWWNSAAVFANGRPADGVLGQANFTSVLPNRGGATALNTMNGPAAVAVNSFGELWVSDLLNSRLLHFAAAPNSGDSADRVLGQLADNTAIPGVTANVISGASAIALDSGNNLWAADSANHRVLRFPAATAAYGAADIVLGQGGLFNSGAVNGGGTTAAGTLNWPSGLSFAAGDTLWVSDSDNNRVLRFPAPVTSATPADLALGQANLTGNLPGVSQTALNGPGGVFADPSGALWVSDVYNSRILRFDSPTANGAAAVLVLGQAHFTGASPNRAALSPAADTLSAPNDILVAGSSRLWIADTANNRLLQSDLSPVSKLFPVLTVVSSMSLTGSWTAAVNPGPGTYVVALSSNSDFNTLASTGAVTALTSGFTALLPATSYYMRVKLSTETDASYSFNTVLAQTAPHATRLFPAFTGVSSGTLTASWTAGAGSAYVVVLSTRSDFSSITSSATQGAAAVFFTGLVPSTSYYLEVKLSTETDAAFAFNTAAFLTRPLGLTPLSATASGLSSSGFTMNWLSLPTAEYVVVFANDPDYTSIRSSVTQAGNSASFSGLSEYTNYYFQVKLSTETDQAFLYNRSAVRTPALAGHTPLDPAFIGAGATTLTASWTGIPGSTYIVALSTDSSLSPVVSSAAQTGASAYFTALTPDTSYYLGVKISTEADAVYTISRAVRKTSLSGAGSSIFISANNSGEISVTWPYVAGASHVLLLATDPGFTTLVSSFTTAPSEYNETYEGLSGLTTYYFAMKLAVEPDASFAYNTEAIYTPGTQAYPYISTVTVTGLTLDWEGAAGTRYTVLLSTESGFGTLVSSTTQAALAKTFTGLSSDTLYYYAVKNAAESDAAFSDLANKGWQRTLPTPLRPVLTAVSSNTLTASWTGMTGSTYVVVLASSSDYTGIISSATQLPSSSMFSGLEPYTTYYFEVKLSTETDIAFSGSLAQKRTLPDGALLAPVLTAVSSNTLTASWTAVSGSTYVAVLASDPNFTVILSSSQETDSPAGYTGLFPDTSYYFMVKLLTEADQAFVLNTAAKRTLTTRIVPSLRPMSPGRLNASWTSFPGAYYTVVLALDSAFTNIVSSITTETVLTDYSGLIGAMPYYLGVKLVTESENAYLVNWSSAVAPAGALRLFALTPNKMLRGDGEIQIIITGEGLTPDSAIRLTRTGYSDVILSSVTWISPGKVTCSVPRSIALGLWNVVVAGGGFTTAIYNGLAVMTADPNSAKIFQGIFKPNLGEVANLTTTLLSPGNVSIRVYDSLGRPVREIFDSFRAAGNYLDTWDGRNESGRICASGVYLIRFECPGFSSTKRVVLVK